MVGVKVTSWIRFGVENISKSTEIASLELQLKNTLLKRSTLVLIQVIFCTSDIELRQTKVE